MRNLLGPTSRRTVLSVALAASTWSAAPLVPPAFGSSALWPRDGLFPDCTPSGCVSSQDDRPDVWDNPWIAEGRIEDDYAKLRRLLTSAKIGGRVTAEDGERYIKAEFPVEQPFGGTVYDDAEFFFTPNDVLVQFRSLRRTSSGGGGGLSIGGGDGGANRKRLEKVRIALGWEKVPVLRNRRRALVVVESPLDSFGPAQYDVDEYGFTARDMVPAEAKRGDMYRGEADPMASPWAPPSAAVRTWMRESDDRVRSK